MMCNDRYEELCDEEKYYHEWVKKNTTYITANKQHIAVMKKIFMDGFSVGYMYRKQIQSEEWLQK